MCNNKNQYLTKACDLQTAQTVLGFWLENFSFDENLNSLGVILHIIRREGM